MASFKRAIIPVRRFLEWDRKDQLILQPKFQRRGVWPDEARSYFIDSLVRGMPVPKVFLRRVVNPRTNLEAYEVVDGQQRLQSILNFFRGDLVLRAKHNEDFPNAKFDDLPQPTRAAFLNYEVSTEIMESAPDSEVWAMFERLNTYTLTLNKQERLNARFFGEFKKTAYKLAADETALKAWKELNVFSDMQISRMKEVELTSDAVAAISDGIDDIKRLPSIYKKYDDKFPNAEKIGRTFKESLQFIRENLAQPVRRTHFKNRAWFYSLLVAVADASAGIPGGKGPHELRPVAEIAERMKNIDEELYLEEVRPELAKLDTALSRGTSLKPGRETRHAYFHALLTQPPARWRKLLGE